jgi:biopolymer transport protein ExbD
MNLPSNPTDRRKGLRKHYLRIDMTPMVDLGFLLITFFVFTTSMMEPTAMKLVMPTERGEPMPVKCSNSFSILVHAGGRTDWFSCEDGAPAQKGESQLAESMSLRAAILGKLRAMEDAGQDPGDLVVLIKPFHDASYKAVVDVLDEMTINGIARYAIVDPMQEER